MDHSFSEHIESVMLDLSFKVSPVSNHFWPLPPLPSCYELPPLSPRPLQTPSHCSCIYHVSLYLFSIQPLDWSSKDLSSTVSLICIAFHLIYGKTQDSYDGLQGPCNLVLSHLSDLISNYSSPCSLCTVWLGWIIAPKCVHVWISENCECFFIHM